MSRLLSFLHATPGRRNLIVLGLGALLVPAFAPFGFAWLAPLVIGIFILALEGIDAREAARTGFMFGFGLFAAGTWWLYISLNILGGLWPPIALLMMFCLAAVMGIFLALMTWGVNRLIPEGNAVRRLIVLPAAWTVIEWLRGWIFTGFPWLSIGYSQTDTPLAALAPLTGVYGISWATLLCGGVLASLVVGTRHERRVALVVAGVLAVLLAGLASLTWTENSGRDLQVRLVQGAVSQELKWDVAQRQPTLDLYRELSLTDDDPDLIIWPEAAVPALPFEVSDFLLEMNAEAVSRGTQLLVGILTYNLDQGQFQNTLWAIGAEGGRYHKRHLVAFGEYFPLPDFARRWLRIMNLPSENILPGENDQPLLTAQGVPLAATICYEMAFGAEQLHFFPEAELMVNVSNDAWFGDSIAPHQHLQIGRMRAMETGRYLLRATNTGITAIVDPFGEVQQRLPQFEKGVLDAVVHPYTGATPYVRVGNWLVISAMCLLVAGGALVSRRQGG
ncbi:MAG: apolipoprotein N-acyltransferase [Gammaproteobacteria bacterium]|nr:apolipoprotein N-acyltransferase [Gammaproteobacteria bacterium]MDP6616766.1 apolipoprotein N-acyltransferase [Gammaproteobacteria bacterium]MDP6695169.1 apolipoprotein N-acyltransferase [Gammaproteobacteria bacterium]